MAKLRIKPINFDANIKVRLEENKFYAEGPKGSLILRIHPDLKVEIKNEDITIVSKTGNKSLTGLFNSLIRNTLTGVKDGFSKSLEMVGVGYRAVAAGNELTLSLGYSHPVKINADKSITFQVTDNKITVSGLDKYLVGETAASIRRLKKPEPYKGKGIRYLGEVIRKKAGKAAKAVGAAAQGK